MKKKKKRKKGATTKGADNEGVAEMALFFSSPSLSFPLRQLADEQKKQHKRKRTKSKKDKSEGELQMLGWTIREAEYYHPHLAFPLPSLLA